MAPVACGVSYGKEYRFVLGFCLLKGLFAPRIPVNWIVGMLQKIRAFFVDQTVGFRRGFHRVSHEE
jgi:hypothetical protein